MLFLWCIVLLCVTFVIAVAVLFFYDVNRVRRDAEALMKEQDDELESRGFAPKYRRKSEDTRRP